MLDTLETSSHKSSLMLGALGIVSLVFYLATNFLIPQSPQYMAYASAGLIHRLSFWSAIARLPIPAPSTAKAVVSIVTATTIFTLACYILALWISQRMIANSINLGIIFGFTILFFLTSLLTLPNFSSDLYWYAKMARVFTVYHANPYAMPPSPAADDPYLQFGGWMQTSTPYGPIWTYLSILCARFGGGDVVRTLLALRTLLFGFNLANALLIWRILRRSKPSYQLVGLLFYAWNPIVVLKGQRHLDTAMVFLLLLSIYLHMTKRERLALVALTLSVLTKFITAPLLIAYLLFLWRHRSFRFALIGAGIVSLTVALAFLPFWDGWDMFLRLAREPGTMAPGSVFTQARRLLFTPGFLLVILWAALRGRGTTTDLVRGWGIILLWFCLFMMRMQYAWYALSLIGIVSLVEKRAIVTMSLALCSAALLTNMIGQVAKPYVSPPIEFFRLIWWGPIFLTLIWICRAYLARIFLLARQGMLGFRRDPLP